MHFRQHLYRLFFSVCLLSKFLSAQDLLSVGCFEKNNITGLFPASQISEVSASACIKTCQNKTERFAGVHNGASCLCGDYYSGKDSSSCNIPCQDKPDEVCGGTSSVSLYETAGGALGAPNSLTLLSNAEESLHISWNPPSFSLPELKQYKICAKPIKFFSERLQPITKCYKYSPLTKRAILDGLHPGVNYEVEVRSVSDKGVGHPAVLRAWTKVGKPDEPKVPQIVSRTSNSIIIELQEVIPSGGPISLYHIIVVDETLPVIVDFDSLYDYHSSSELGLPYYITAELTSENFEKIFTVGDGKYYGKYFNSPLVSKKDYHILLGVLSTINETKASYSPSTHSQHESSHLEFIGNANNHHHLPSEKQDDIYSSNPNNGLILGLSIAIGLFAFLLFASILVYFALRVHFRRNSRHSADHQELAVHAHNPHQDYENGYAVGAHYLDDEDSSPDHYRLLREKVAIIPHHSINIVGDIGVGKFGDVKKGVSLNTGSDQINTLIHRIQDDALSLSQKSEMLKEFDLHVRVGKHPNIVSLLGMWEELNIISVVFEYEAMTLKSCLVESRAVVHYPVYAEKNRRFSTLQEHVLLEILGGVAKGMKHLSSLNIPHGQLCARNIALRDGAQPKIKGFGLLNFHNDVYVPDYRRWQAPEVLRMKTTTSCLSDLWSFGCLMWEVVTLGGTPYVDVRTEEISSRIVRGLRLSQPQYVSDELYQSMLLCWQNDPEERLSFDELHSLLSKLASDDVTPHLLFSLYPSFKYELHSGHLEFVE